MNDLDTTWVCATCGWEWPHRMQPPPDVECDNCGDDAFEPAGGPVEGDTQ